MKRYDRFISGLNHCHKMGVRSCVIAERDSPEVGMLRIFQQTSDSLSRLIEERDGRKQFLLAPHNHRQDITLYGLEGHATNIDFAVETGKHCDHKAGQFILDSSAVLQGEFLAHYRDSVHLEVSQVRPLAPLEPVPLKWSDTHNIVAEKWSAWLVAEGQQAPPGAKGYLYTYEGPLEVDVKGMYVRFPDWELREISAHFNWDLINYVIAVHRKGTQ